MLILYVNHNTIDVFFNKGWDNWGRFKISHKQNNSTKCYQVAGSRVSPIQFEQLETIFNVKQ